MGLFKSRGRKLEAGTESLLKKAEKEINKAKEIGDLKATQSRLAEQSLKLGETILEINRHSGNLALIQNKLALIAAELRELLAGEQTGRTIGKMRVLGERAKKLKQDEAELQTELAKFEKEELRIEALEAQQERLQQMMDSATKKSEEILNEMMENISDMADQTSLILDEALGNIFGKP